MKQPTIRPARAGFTLVELLIAAMILGLMLGSLVMVCNAHDRAYKTGIARAHLEAQIPIALERIVTELRTAGNATLLPDPTPGLGCDSLQYAQASDVVGTQVSWSPPRRLEFAYEVGELDDGLDNNGNGLVDEGRVLLTEDVGGANERSLVLTRWVAEHYEGELPNGLDDNGNGLVDERGFVVERSHEPESKTLVVRLCLQRVSPEGQLFRRTAQTSIRVRN